MYQGIIVNTALIKQVYDLQKNCDLAKGQSLLMLRPLVTRNQNSSKSWLHRKTTRIANWRSNHEITNFYEAF
eukprot:1657514-Amphidinium_carterae.1